jgi:hypothetical protein
MKRAPIRLLSFVPIALAALSGVAGAQAPRYRATLLTTNGTFGGLNNVGQVTYGDFSTTPHRMLIRESDGTTRFSWVGPINDHGIVQVMGNISRLWNTNTNTSQNIPIVPPYYYDDYSSYSFNGISNSGKFIATYEHYFNGFESLQWSSPTNGNPIRYNGLRLEGGKINNLDDTAYWISNTRKAVIFRGSGETQLIDFGHTTFVNGLAHDGRATVVSQSSDTSPYSSRILRPDLSVEFTLPNMANWDSTAWGIINGQNVAIGQVSAYDMDPNFFTRATIWTPHTGPLFLDEQIENLSGKRLHQALAINERGEIVAYHNYTVGGNPTVMREVYLLQPVPEPATMAGLGVGVLALLRRRKQK